MTGSSRDVAMAEGGFMLSSIVRFSSCATSIELRITSLGFMSTSEVTEVLCHTLENSVNLFRGCLWRYMHLNVYMYGRKFT